MVEQQKKQQQIQHNVLAIQKKEQDVRRKQLIQADVVICINQIK